MLAVEPEPHVRRLMMHVRGIEQRNQYVHVKKCDHASRLRHGADSQSPASRAPRPLRRGKVGTPLRLRAVPARGVSALRASSDSTCPAVVPRLAANSLAVSSTSSSMSNVAF